MNHNGMVRGKKLKRVWSVAWITTIWSMWLHRNNIIFNQEQVNLLSTFDLIKVRSWHWVKIKVGGEFTFADWCTTLFEGMTLVSKA